MDKDNIEMVARRSWAIGNSSNMCSNRSRFGVEAEPVLRILALASAFSLFSPSYPSPRHIIQDFAT